MKKVEATVGEHISTYIRRALEIAKKVEEDVECSFNGITWVVYQNDTEESAAKKLETKRNEYYSSEEYLERAAKIEAETAERRSVAQEKIDAAMEIFKTLNFKNDIDVIKWIESIVDPIDFIGVEVDKKLIVSTLQSNGFVPNDCVGDKFVHTRECEARYIIGQVMDMLDKVGSIHPVIGRFCAQWQEKYI